MVLNKVLWSGQERLVNQPVKKMIEKSSSLSSSVTVPMIKSTLILSITVYVATSIVGALFLGGGGASSLPQDQIRTESKPNNNKFFFIVFKTFRVINRSKLRIY